MLKAIIPTLGASHLFSYNKRDVKAIYLICAKITGLN